MNHFSKVSASLLAVSLLVGCGAESDDPEGEIQVGLLAEEEINLEDLNFEELTPSEIPYQFWDEYEAYVEETRDRRDPRNLTYEFREVTEAGENVSITHINEEGLVTVLNYMGDSFHAGEDCYSLPATYTTNAALHNSLVEPPFSEEEEYRLEFGEPNRNIGYTIVWDKNDVGFVSNIRLEDASGETIAESGSRDGTLDAIINMGDQESQVLISMEPVDYDMDIVMEKQCQSISTAAYEGGGDIHSESTVDFIVVTDQTALGGRTVGTIPMRVAVGFIDYHADRDCYEGMDHVEFYHSAEVNTEASYAKWVSPQRPELSLNLDSDGFLTDTENFKNSSATPVGNGKAEEILNNFCTR